MATRRSSHPRHRGRRVLALLGLLALIAGTAPLQSAGAVIRRPDLAVASVTNPPMTVVRGAALPLTTVVKNGGRAKAGPSTLRFYISKNRTKGATDKKLQQVRSIPGLLPGKTSKGKTTLRLPATLAAGGFYIVACADDLKKVRESNETNNCKASRGFDLVPGTSSSDRIDAAVAAGTITAEQGMVYETYAAFGDTRLPAAYRGDDVGSFHAGDLTDVSTSFDTMSPTAKGAVAPFLMPPAYPGTWEELSTADAANTTQSHIQARSTRALAADPPMHPSPLGENGWFLYQHARANIWFRTQFPAHQVFAGQLFEAMEEVHTDLTGLMGTTPLSDAGPHPFVDKNGVDQVWGDGGSGILDIYVMPISGATGALTVTYPPGCTGRPSFIVMDPYFKANRATHARDALAHEFMHVLQYTYDYAAPCKDYQDMDEATANWAIDYVYPTDQFEHDWNNYVWKNWIPSLAQNDYDAWNFFLFLEHTMSPSAIADIYTGTEVSGPWDAVDSVVSGGLADKFPEFLRKSWNQTPESPHFETWDSLSLKPQLATDGSATGVGPKPVRFNQPFPMPMKLPALGHAYYNLTFADEDIVKIKYENALSGNSNIDIRAFAKLQNGTWLDQDWSDESEVEFCRDKTMEDVQELIIIVANTQFDDLNATADATNRITTEGNCLPEKYVGSFSGAHRAVDMPEIPYETPLETWSGNVTFTRYTGTCNGQWWCFDPAYQPYTAEAGSGSWSATGGSPCMVSAGGSYSLLPLENGEEAVLIVRKRPPAGHTYSTYRGSISKVDTQPGTSTCEGEDPVDVDWTTNIGWQPSHDFEANADGTLVGTETISVKNPYIYFSWNLTPQP